MANNGATSDQLKYKFNWRHHNTAQEYIENSKPLLKRNASLLSGLNLENIAAQVNPTGPKTTQVVNPTEAKIAPINPQKKLKTEKPETGEECVGPVDIGPDPEVSPNGSERTTKDVGPSDDASIQNEARKVLSGFKFDNCTINFSFGTK